MEEIIQEALSKGVEMHVAGEFELAGKLYSSVMQMHPKHADANHNMGLLKVDSGQVLEALPYLQTALQADTSVAQFWLSYIKALIKLDKTDEATRILRLAKESGVENEELLELHQQFYETFTKTDPDASEIDRLSQPRANVLDTLNLDKALREAKNNVKKGSFEEAERIYRDILEKFPKNKRAHRSLAVLRKAKKPATNHLPSKDAMKKLINFYLQGQLTDAVDHAQALTTQYPEAFTIWNILGAANAGLGQLDVAIANYKKAIKIQPDYAEAYFNMGSVFQEKGNLEKAIKSYNRALAIQPDYYEALYNIGLSFHGQGQCEKAIDAYNKALSLRPDQAETYYNKGSALYGQEKFEDAIESYKKALAIKPDYAEAYDNMASALKFLNKTD